jgi:pimeloyl-ACP methyl ester carboxylesterase
VSAQTFATSDGATIGYVALGASAAPRTLICHPGGPGMSGAYFGDLCGLPSERVRVVLLDPRGTGTSSPPIDGRYELEDYATDIDELRDHLGLERIDLLGHSHGGFVAMVYALSYPERLGRLVLACSAPRFGDELREEAEAAFAAHRGKPWFEDAIDAQRRRQAWDFASRDELAALYAREARLWFADDAAAEAFLSEIRRQRPDPEALRYFNTSLAPSYDMRPHLHEIRAPTLILNGAADFFGPEVSARELSAIPDSRATIIPSAGHFTFVEAPDRFRSELETFLQL